MRKLWLALALWLLAAPALAQVVTVAPFPQGAQVAVVTSSNTGTTGAISAGITGAATKWTYVCGFTVTSAGTTTATSGTVTLSGTTGGNMSFIYVFPSSGQGVLGIAFPGCIASAATGMTISVNVPAGGTGTTVGTNLWGYRN